MFNQVYLVSNNSHNVAKGDAGREMERVLWRQSGELLPSTSSGNFPKTALGMHWTKGPIVINHGPPQSHQLINDTPWLNSGTSGNFRLWRCRTNLNVTAQGVDPGRQDNIKETTYVCICWPTIHGSRLWPKTTAWDPRVVIPFLSLYYFLSLYFSNSLLLILFDKWIDIRITSFAKIFYPLPAHLLTINIYPMEY